MSTTANKIDIRQAIIDGKYNNNVPYPERPKKPSEPAIFNLRAGDLSEKNLESLAQQRKEYEAALKAYDATAKEREAKMRAYNQEQNRCEERFKADCEFNCFGVATGEIVKKKKAVVWAKAWGRGHADGYENVWYWYEEFAGVANIGF